ncbi:MAG: hypothetical protein HXY23_06650 [Parvularculaceae bacterium]|jgi:hypothetical protein|nr:hypothetical protein [Parvularculaceae bacterium]
MSGEDDSRGDGYARLDGKVASLSAALLARKGAAAPSLKRFVSQQRNNPFASCEAGAACAAELKAVKPKRAAISLRLPVPDFLRLKLAAAELERTSQAILLDALRTYLDGKGVETFDECPCLKKAAAAAEAERGAKGP